MSWDEFCCHLYLENFHSIISTSILMSTLRKRKKHAGHILSLELLSLGSPDRSENIRFNRKRYWRLIQSSRMSLVFTMKKTLTSSRNNWISILTPTLTLKLTLTLSLLLTLTLALPLTPSLNQALVGGLCSGSHPSWTLTQQVGEHMHSERWYCGKVTWHHFPHLDSQNCHLLYQATKVAF